MGCFSALYTAFLQILMLLACAAAQGTNVMMNDNDLLLLTDCSFLYYD